MLGAEIAKKYGEAPKLSTPSRRIMSRWSRSVRKCLVAAAEALSAARPGARREALESYVKRLEKLESLAPALKACRKRMPFKQAGKFASLSARKTLPMASRFNFPRDLAKKIEQELTYPGQIKVTVIRESRYVEYAK